jgi:hypothetical protein
MLQTGFLFCFFCCIGTGTGTIFVVQEDITGKGWDFVTWRITATAPTKWVP